jgi:hypothetical protein
MAPKAGKRVAGGGYLDFAELTEDGPVVCCFRIREFCDPEPGDYGPKVPVVVDVAIMDGDRAGELHLDQKLIGAPTGPLRGVRNPKKGEEPQPPVNELGDELYFSVQYIERRGSQPFVGLNQVSASEEAAANRFFAANGGDEGFWEREPTTGAAREPVGAGAPSNGTKRRKPFGS